MKLRRAINNGYFTYNSEGSGREEIETVCDLKGLALRPAYGPPHVGLLHPHYNLDGLAPL